MFPSILKVDTSPLPPKTKNTKPSQLQDHQQVTGNGEKTEGIPKYSKLINTPEKKNPRENIYFYTSKD